MIKIKRWDECKDGPLSETAMRAKLEALGYVVNVWVYPVGTSFPEHDHAEDKVDGVLKGRFKVSMLGESVVLETGDCIIVPKGVLHSAEVVGEEEVVSLDAIKY